MRPWVWRPSVNGSKMCRHEISLEGPLIRTTFCLLLFSSFSEVFSSPLCSSHQTTRISKDIIMSWVPAGLEHLARRKPLSASEPLGKRNGEYLQTSLLSFHARTFLEWKCLGNFWITSPFLSWTLSVYFSSFVSRASQGEAQLKNLDSNTCMTMDELFQLSASQFLHLQNGN